MRNHLLLALLSVMVFSCTMQQTDWDKYAVTGKVKSIYLTTKFNGEVSEDEIESYNYNSLVEFDENGNITVDAIINDNGKIGCKHLYVYDDNNLLKKIENYLGDGCKLNCTVFSYDDNDKVVKEVSYPCLGDFLSIIQKEWDGDKLIKSKFEDKDFHGTLSAGYTIYEYDGDELVKTIEYDASGKPTGEYSEYKNNKATKIVNPKYTSTFEYNDKGLCISSVNGRNGERNLSISIDGESYLYEYEYDEKGNWIKKIEKDMKSKKARYIYKREIEYY